jgi:pseudolysin
LRVAFHATNLLIHRMYDFNKLGNTYAEKCKELDLMHPNYYFSPLAVALALGLSTPVDAAKPIALNKANFNQIQKQFNVMNSGLSQAAVATNGLQLISQHTDKKRMNHLRMQQYYAGFPVVGGYAVFHSKKGVQLLGADSSSVTMNGTLYEGLQTELGQPTSSFKQNAPQVLEQFKAQYANKNLSEEQVTPIVFIDEDQNAHWAYKLSLLVNHDDKIPERPTAIIDATTQKTLVQWNDIKTITNKSVKGMGFGGNHKVGEYQFGKNLPLLDLTRDSVTETCFMENTAVKVVDMKHRYSSRNKAMEFACHVPVSKDSDTYYTGYFGDGYDKDNGASSPTNDALYAGYVIKHMYLDWYGIEALKKSDGSPMQLVMRVHYGDAYENAYWDGKQMTFGDGDTMMYPLVSLGVGGHEVSHGFTEQNAGLEYYGQSGGMNEAFSDMAAQAAEYYSVGKVSWQIGSEIMKEGSGYDALRYMDKPSRDGQSIDSADEYYAGLDVHYSSGVYNHLFYMLANQPNWNVRKAFDVMVKANMDYWTPYSDFKDGACGVLSATQDLGYSVEDVKNSLNQVAIDSSSCS